MGSCNVAERVSFLSKYVPPSPDYWVVLWDTGNIQYVLSDKGVKVYGAHREPGLPILSKQEIKLKILPKKVIDRICSSRLVKEVYQSLKKFYEDNYSYLDAEKEREVKAKLKELQGLLQNMANGDR